MFMCNKQSKKVSVNYAMSNLKMTQATLILSSSSLMGAVYFISEAIK